MTIINYERSLLGIGGGGGFVEPKTTSYQFQLIVRTESQIQPNTADYQFKKAWDVRPRGTGVCSRFKFVNKYKFLRQSISYP